MMPRLISGCPSFARSCAMRTSQACASSHPPPSAWPLIRRDDRFSDGRRRTRRRADARSTSRCSTTPRSRSSFTSAPATNAFASVGAGEHDHAHVHRRRRRRRRRLSVPRGVARSARCGRPVGRCVTVATYRHVEIDRSHSACDLFGATGRGVEDLAVSSRRVNRPTSFASPETPTISPSSHT